MVQTKFQSPGRRVCSQSFFVFYVCVFYFNIFFLIPLMTLSGSPQFHASSFCISFLLSTYYVGAPKPGPGPFIQNRGHEGPGRTRLRGRLSPRQPWDLRRLCSLGCFCLCLQCEGSEFYLPNLPQAFLCELLSFQFII